MLKAEEAARNSVCASEEPEGELRICSASSYASEVLPEILLACMRRYPKIRITVKVSDYLEDAHNQAGNKTYNDEAALSYAIRLAYYAARKYYTEVLELDSGKGYADIAYIPAPKYPDIPALVIELKYNQTADTALNQIRRQKYPDRLAHYEGNILLVAVNYDRDVPNTNPGFKHHSCRIEEA
jgi:hypothetical protein